MHADQHHSIQRFVDLVDKPLSRELAPTEFESQYFSLWGSDRTVRSPEVLAALERFFFLVEDYVDDPQLRDEPRVALTAR